MEHETPVDGDATGSEHSSGSAVAYEGTSTPANRPDGSTALANNAIDRGRLWLDDNSDPPVLKRWAGAAFETVNEAAYAGGESITLLSGLILKFGVVTGQAPSQSNDITFGAAFPNAIIFGMAASAQSAGETNAPSAHTKTTTKLTVYFPASVTTVNWLAIGY
jgi:hypothetical protein